MTAVRQESVTPYPFEEEIASANAPHRAGLGWYTTYSPRDANGNRTCENVCVSDAPPPPPPQKLSKETDADRAIADYLHTRIGKLAVDLFTGKSTDPTHIVGAFDPEWVSNLSLSDSRFADRESNARFYLIDDNGGTEFYSAPDMIGAYHHGKPRTQVYTSIDMLGGWPNAIAERLRWDVPEAEMIVSAYMSMAGDATFGRHRDTSPGVAMQLDGVKDWDIRGKKFTMRPGDALTIPRGVPHEVWTPENPGLSVHCLISAVARG